MKTVVALARNPWLRGLAVLASLALALVVLWWRGPDWDTVYHAFDFVRWRWVAVGVMLNLLSVAARAWAWNLTIHQAMPQPKPRFAAVFSAFGVGLLGNAVLPARAGELARVAVLRRHVEAETGTSATLLGTVFAHRVFDIFPIALLVGYVALTAKLPDWAITGLVALGLVGVALLTVAVLSARRAHGEPMHGERTARRLLAMARQGLAVMRVPTAAFAAILFQAIGWTLQLLAVWAVTEAFDLDVPLPAAALVLLLMNVATIFPLWPGNVGLLQAAVALPLVQYGVAYGTGFAYGLVLQAIEMSVGVGVGLVMLAREGISFAALTRMDDAEEVLDEISGERAAHSPEEAEAVLTEGRARR
ncbi:MAG: flippase-like domain-containing protein [Actinobacteria bacterium]|nr:flippase-like domain-containing protein [Actinomycetota bacterium]